MRNFKFFAAAIMMVGMLFVACDKLDQPQPMDTYNGNVLVGAKVANDKIIGYKFNDARERFVEGGIEYSFIHVDVYEKEGEVPAENRTIFVKELTHNGIEPQYFHYSDVAFTTTRGQEEVLDDVISEPVNGWKAVTSSRKQNFSAKNASENEFFHSTTTGASAITYTLADNEEIKGYTIEFPIPTWEITEKTLENEDVTGVAYDGKTWEATKYESEITANFKIAENFRMSGEEGEKSLTASNIAFFLKHVVTVELEDLQYVGNFFAEGAKLDTKEEKVSGALVTYDNKEQVKRDDFAFAMQLSYVLSQPADVVVNSEKELTDNSISFSKGAVTSVPTAEGVFVNTKFTGEDGIKTADRDITGSFQYENYAWGGKVLANAKISDDRKANMKVEKNETLSTNARLVCTVTVTVPVTVCFEGINRKAENYEVSVKYNRIYELPDDYTKEYEQKDYVLELQSETPAKVSAKKQYNTVRTITKNHGEVVSTSEKAYGLELYAMVSAGDTTKVTEAFKPQVLSIEDHANKSDWTGSADEDGFNTKYNSDSQTIRFKGGNVVEFEWYDQTLYQNGKEVYDHATVHGVSASDISVSEPVLVDSVRVDGQDKKLYRIDVKFTPDVTSTKTAQTKASSNNVNTDAVVTSIYQLVVEDDEYIDGKDEVEEFIEPNANGGIDAGIKLYEYYTKSGRQYVGEARVSFAYSFEGGAEEAKIVDSVNNPTQSGNGHTGTGKGTYTNNIVLNGNDYAQRFSYEADGAKTAKVAGKGGKGAERTFTPNFVIEDTGLTKGAESVSDGYTLYPYASNAKATLSLGDVKVSKSAESTRTFKVKVADELVSKRTTIDYTKNGDNVDYVARLYETWRDAGEKLKDEKKGTVNFIFTGGNEDDVVVTSVNNPTQSGNGHKGTGKGTYTNNIVNNGTNYAQNFNYDAPASFDVTLNGTKGSETVNVPISFEIVDMGLTGSAKSVSGDYYVYPYASNAKATMTVGTVSVSKNASSTRNLKVKRDIPKIIPEEWGKITFANFSAVPAHLINLEAGFTAGNIADGDGAQTAASCMLIGTDKGAIPVVFGWADNEPRVPTTEQILGSTFTAGNYDKSYNSGYYNTFSASVGALNAWIPAKASDPGTGINYDIPGIASIRFVRNESLAMWGWRGGNYSTVLSGYSCTVDNGTLTVKYNGEIVLEIR